MMSFTSFTAENRLEKWKELLGIDGNIDSADFEHVTREEVLKNTKTRVINQDVLRTRADEPFFRYPFVKCILKQTLIRFCSHHRIDYMQGLNEILAPVLTLNTISFDASKYSIPSGGDDVVDNDDYSDVKHPFGINLIIFEKLMAKMSPTTFSTRGVNAIQVQLTAFHLLLTYHEPVLSMILRKEGMTPDIYAMSWLITLFARRQPISRALHIWDILLQLNTPHISVFLAVALIRSHKNKILSSCADALPETLVAMKFESDDEIDTVFADALRMLQSTPRGIINELEKLGFSTAIEESVREKGLKDLWVRYNIESYSQMIIFVLTRELFLFKTQMHHTAPPLHHCDRRRNSR